MPSYPLSLPSIPGFSQFDIRKMPVVGRSRSPYSGKAQATAYPGQWWEADIALSTLNAANAAKWEAFLGRLNGSEGTFLMGDPVRTTPRGAATGTPVVAGNQAARSKTLDITGAAHSVTGWLMEGDYIQLGSAATTRLHQVTEDANTDSSGNATLSLWPSLRDDATDGATVTVTNCKGIFYFSTNALTVQRTRGPLASFSCTVFEDV